MAESKNDGGPAFPVSTQAAVSETRGPYGHQDSAGTWQFPGLTIRDYFAIRCLPISRSTFPDGMDGGWAALAAHAYGLADAMLAAREAA